jgi:adenosylcobinamide-GDP ribazoletransferase
VGPVVAALVVVLVFGMWMQRRLGGLTGDAYGAAIELAELAALVAALGGV